MNPASATYTVFVFLQKLGILISKFYPYLITVFLLLLLNACNAFLHVTFVSKTDEWREPKKPQNQKRMSIRKAIEMMTYKD